MIPGGIADKLGNRYEAKWLVRCLMDVIDGNKANWLNFESVETEYQGFEFAISRVGITEWHQTKINAPGGNWTLNALKKEGVLKAFSNRLSTDDSAHCFFVSQDNAKDFRTLTEKARTANTHTQHVQILSAEQHESFKQLQQYWSQPDEIVFDWLRRSYVRFLPEMELDSLNESFGDFYFHQGGKNAFPILRDILENYFNKLLSTEAARQVIKLQGTLKFKEWAFDPTIPQKLIEETDAYLQTYTPFGVGGESIVRVQSSNVIEGICNPDGPELILLAGVAGSGKSGVVRSIIGQLHEHNIPHLAFRVDQHLTYGSREKLGKKLTGRDESPVSTLKGTFPNSTSVLIIDQVDAISEVSGRDGQIKEVIFRLISDAHHFGNVKIIVVCRTFDLDSDPRLKSLKADNRTKQIDVPLLDWNVDVEPLLKKKGIDVSTYREPQRQLLCLPVNLAVFLEIDDPKLLFHSRSNLHEKLIEKKQRDISRRQTSWPLIKALTAMCDWMTDRQKLSAPVSVLDNYVNAVDILTSEGLIVKSRGQINFFHESFFDHVFARAFVTRDQNLVDLLTTTEQHLFRRTQVRQILESFRQNDSERYLTELSSVLFDKEVRFHIKSAICQWLNSVENPTEAEFKIISQFDQPCDKFHQFFRYAVFSTTWFDFLNGKGWIRRQLEGENQERVEAVLWWLSNIAGEHPLKIAELLRNWWSNQPQRAKRLLNWFGYLNHSKANDDLLLLCKELINTYPDNLLRSQNQDCVDMLLHSWNGKSSEHCGEILHAIFNAWFELDPEGNPFANDDFEKRINHSLTEIADKAPNAFLLGTTDALARAIDKVVETDKEGKNWYIFNYRIYAGHRSGFDDFLAMYRSSLKQVLQQNPTITNSYLDKLNPFKHQCFMHLHLEAIQANPTGLASQLPKLANEPMAFEAGFHGADWWSFAHACREAFPALDLQEKTVIEQIILNHNPEIEWNVRNLAEINRYGETEHYLTKKGVIRGLKFSRFQQWCILEIIGEELLTSIASARLNELRRKFPKRKVPTPSSNGELASFVGSPIKRSQCEKMSDSHWLAAIKHYNNDQDRRQGRNFFDGGASQLALELQEATKNQPTRFVDLSLKILDTDHSSYIEHILWGLSETERASDESLIQAVKRAHRHRDKPFGRAIARLVQKFPQIAADTEILELLIWYALNGEASEDGVSDIKNMERETITIDTLIKRGGSLYMRGINGTRGWMWEALATVLWKVPEAMPKVWDALDLAIESEPLVSVRCCMMQLLAPLFNADKPRFSKSMRKLICLPNDASQTNDAMYLSPLITHQGLHLFPHVFYWLPELANELITELLECGDETKQLIAAWLVFYESFRSDNYIARADQLSAVSIDHQRLLASVAADAFSWTGDRNRAEALLKMFFFDKDEQIRKLAAGVFRNVQGTDVDSYHELIMIFLQSPAFFDNTYSVLRMLESATCEVLDLVITACEQLILGIAKDKRRGIDAHQLESVLKREYVSSESHPDARKKILDMIDLMLSHEIYGIDSIVTAHDRW